MKLRMGLTPFGAVAIDEHGKLAGKIDFSSDPQEAARELLNGEAALTELSTKLKGVVTREGFDLAEAVEALGKTSEFPEFSKKLATELIVLQMRIKVGRDMLIIQAINALDDLNISINSLSVRLKEWYGLHFPELAQEIVDNHTYVKEVQKGKRSKLSDFAKLAEGSMGIELTDKDIEAIKSFASKIEKLFDEKAELESHLESLMREVAPNVTSLAGASLGARLVAKAGGLGKLAFFPSSTIQLLGAEKALFKHIVMGTPTPKHGLIFQHPAIAFVTKDKRGKVARALASKLAIAARMDYFGHALDTSLSDKFEKRFEAIKEMHHG